MEELAKMLNWRFDVSTFKLLGRELITDRITAVFELVKNCYDANAEQVTIEFHHVGKLSAESKIIIKDDGIGMSFEDITNKWMVIGTSSKRQQTVSASPYNRTFIGEKGIGRFAVEKLGAKLLMRTKKEGQNFWNVLEIDWDFYEKLTQLNLFEIQDFTKIENTFRTEKAETSEKGTELIISDARDIWTKLDLDRLYKELSKLISPFNIPEYPFIITIKSNEYQEYLETQVQSISVEEFVTIQFSLDYDIDRGKQEIVVHEKGELIKKENDIDKFGPVKFTLYYFDESAKKLFKRRYPKGTRFYDFIDGIKIYRDGIITTPFAEYQGDQDKKRDILGIDKRRYSGFWSKMSSRELIGILEITKIYNPKIIDSTNRQDFVDNEEYRSLKNFIIHELIELESYRNKLKKEKIEKTLSNLEIARKTFEVFTKAIEEARKNTSELSPILDPIAEQANELRTAISEGIKEQKQAEKEKEQRENLFHSLMSIQEYAHEMADIIRNSLGAIKRRAQYFVNYFLSPSKERQYAEQMYNELNKLSKAVDFMQSYTKSNLKKEWINLKELIENLFNEIYSEILEEEHIKTIIEIDNSLTLNHNRKFLEDIFLCLITNSIKALKERSEKIIKCSSLINEKEFIIYFSDNGKGIEKDIHDKIFAIFFTTTAEEGGAGIGLYTVKKRIEALQGSIEVAESEFQHGATFKITIPFKK